MGLQQDVKGCAPCVGVEPKQPDPHGNGEEYQLHVELRDLPRSADVFSKIAMDPIMTYRLPKPGCTAGRVLEHAINTFNRLHQRYRPMTFKFGITHDPHFRWHNSCFGYKNSKERFDRMHTFYAAANPYGPAFLEAALIDRFSSNMFALQDR